MGGSADGRDHDQEGEDAANGSEYLVAPRPGLPGSVTLWRPGWPRLLAIRRLSLRVSLLRLALVPGVTGLRPILRAWREWRLGRLLAVGRLVSVWLLRRILWLVLSSEWIPRWLRLAHDSPPRGAGGRALPVQETRKGCRRCTACANLTYLRNRSVAGVAGGQFLVDVRVGAVLPGAELPPLGRVNVQASRSATPTQRT
jgi:hypothetical protein